MHTKMSTLRLIRLATSHRALDAAHAIGVNESMMCRIELGDARISPTRLARLADLYRCEIDVLLGREPLVVRGSVPRISAS